jgi:hypothetical protein
METGKFFTGDGKSAQGVAIRIEQAVPPSAILQLRRD